MTENTYIYSEREKRREREKRKRTEARYMDNKGKDQIYITEKEIEKNKIKTKIDGELYQCDITVTIAKQLQKINTLFSMLNSLTC